MTRDEAQTRVDERFTRIERNTLAQGRCYESWTELWEAKKDLVDVDDVKAFELLPRGQGHQVQKLSESQIKLHCVCDSGD